jgi:hypothetical protein
MGLPLFYPGTHSAENILTKTLAPSPAIRTAFAPVPFLATPRPTRSLICDRWVCVI